MTDERKTMNNHHKKLLFRLYSGCERKEKICHNVCGSVRLKNDDNNDNDDYNNAPPEDNSSPWIPLSPPGLLKVQKVDWSRAERLGLGNSLIAWLVGLIRTMADGLYSELNWLIGKRAIVNWPFTVSMVPRYWGEKDEKNCRFITAVDDRIYFHSFLLFKYACWHL